MQLESLIPVDSPAWILALLPSRLPGQVKRTFSLANGNQGLIIKPLVRVPFENGEWVEQFFAFDHGSQFSRDDFLSFQWDEPGQRSFNKSKNKYEDPKAISLTSISIAELESLIGEFKRNLAEDLRSKLEKEEKELDKKQQEVDKQVEERVKDRLTQIEDWAHKLEQREAKFQAEIDSLTAELEEREQQLYEKAQEQERLLDQRKDELRSLADSIKQQQSEAERLVQSVEPYRLAIPPQTKAVAATFTEIKGIPEKLASQWQNALASNGLILPETLAVSYLVSLLSAFYSGSLVLLNGPVGVGKASIVKESAKLLGGTSKVIPVRPAWLDPTDLLGFFDPIKEVFRPSPFLNALKDARDLPESLNLICLDELNLARIENYGADLLSALEYSRSNYTHKEEVKTKQGLLLYSESIETELWQEAKYLNEKPDRSDKEQQRLEQLKAMLSSYQANFHLSSNTAILGTLNSDETTYDLSPKVIDRAYVISYPAAELDSMLTTEGVSTNPDLQQPLSLSVSTLTDEISLRLRQLFQPELSEQPETEAFIQGLTIGWKKVLWWNQSFSGLGIPLGHRASRDFKVIYAVCNVLGLSSQDCLGHFLFTKLLPRVSFFKGPDTPDQYDQWLSAVRKDFNDPGTKLDDYDPGDVLEQIQAQVEDTKRQHVRYWVRT
jgi:predicted nuclease with TOPRIM domain